LTITGGRIKTLSTALYLAAIISCGPKNSDTLSLNPKILFSVQSDIFREADAIALKGTIELESDRGVESGDFTAFLAGPDSLSFLVEGLLNVDLLRMVIVGDSSFLKSRDMDSWQAFETSDRLYIDEYDIEGIEISSFGPLLFPQYYLMLTGSNLIGVSLVSDIDGASYTALSKVSLHFLLRRYESEVSGEYDLGKKFGDTTYPSRIRISDLSNRWHITLQIQNIKLNPSIPDKVWRISS